MFHELASDESVCEFLGQQLCVGVADVEGDHRAGIAEDGLAHFGRELFDVLVAESEATVHAFELAFSKVQEDVGFREAVWLMTQLGVAGGANDPAAHLDSVGILPRSTSVVEAVLPLVTLSYYRSKFDSEIRSQTLLKKWISNTVTLSERDIYGVEFLNGHIRTPAETPSL